MKVSVVGHWLPCRAKMSYGFAVCDCCGTHHQAAYDYCKVILDKSTVPVGTSDKVRSSITQELVKREAFTPFGVVRAIKRLIWSDLFVHPLTGWHGEAS
jgi:hypothetical protein